MAAEDDRGGIVSPVLTTRARAKLNLSLHVVGRRPDGYHALESLVAFASVADHLSLDADKPEGLIVQGPFASAAGEDQDNLVLKAVRQLRQFKPALRCGHLTLTKYLPAQAGLGGGSADAAATLRLLARLNGLSLDDPELLEAARLIGADVPVCLRSRPVMMRGIGDELGEVLNLPKIHAVLVKPPVGMATPEVFRQLGLEKGEQTNRLPHPECSATSAQELIVHLHRLGNDLQAPANAIGPVIGEALAALSQQQGCRLARMSGSGSAVFALFESAAQAKNAAGLLAGTYGNWWVKPTVIG